MSSADQHDPGTPSGLSPAASEVLEEIYRRFTETAEWPRYRDLEIDRLDDEPPFHDVMWELEKSHVAVERPISDPSLCFLEMEAFRSLSDADTLLGDLSRVARFLATRFLKERREFKVSGADVMRDLHLSEDAAKQVFMVIDHAVQSLAGVAEWSGDPTTAALRVRGQAHFFRDVEGPDDLLEAEARAQESFNADHRRGPGHEAALRSARDAKAGVTTAENPAAAGKIERVFLSHAAGDHPIAERLSESIRVMLPEASVFVASRPGHIDTGEEWWPRIQREIHAADAFVILLTPASVSRSWVIFECGAAWHSGRPALTICARGLDRGAVEEPLKYFQITSIEHEIEARAAFRPWGLELDDPEQLSEDVRRISQELDAVPVEGWDGIEYEGRYFAWDGPELHRLADRDAEPTPLGLDAALREVGLEPSYGLPSRLEKAFARGAKRVFETDRRNWRRALVGSYGEQILLVRESSHAS